MRVYPPIYKSVMRDMNFNPLAPFAEDRAYYDLEHLEINIVPKMNSEEFRPEWFDYTWST